MDNIRLLSTKYIKENRWSVLRYAFILSLLSSTLISLSNKVNLTFVGIFASTIIVYVFYSQINEYGNLMSRGKVIDKSIIFFKPLFSKRHILGFLYFLIIAIISALMLLLLTKIKQIALLILAFTLILGIIAIGSTSIFLALDNDPYSDIKKSIKIVIQEKKMLLYYLSKFIVTILQGSLIITFINIFAFAPQIENILANAEATPADIMVYFENPLSNFIQITGSQMIVFYILFIGVAIYKSYVFQKKVK